MAKKMLHVNYKVLTEEMDAIHPSFVAIWMQTLYDYVMGNLGDEEYRANMKVLGDRVAAERKRVKRMHP